MSAGSSTAGALADGASYYAWTWEQILATVLNIGIPDRAEVTGQPWTVIQQGGAASPGLHLIWTANGNASPNAGSTPTQVYLSPAVYAAGGAWDRFLNVPAQALSGVPAGSYGGLPMIPPSFQAARLAVADVTTLLDTAAQQFSSMRQQAISPSAGFQGNAADMLAELLGNLRSVMTSLYGQMTSPAAYSDAIGTAGDSAAKLLSDILAAHASWTQVPEYSPLGALVQVLAEIAAPVGDGSYEIADPQHTQFGDLTTGSAWQLVEQQAKSRWTSTLTGGSPDFTGLDVLGRVALGKLVDQYATTTSSVVPVIGPAQPALQTNKVGTPNPATAGSDGPGGGNVASSTHAAVAGSGVVGSGLPGGAVARSGLPGGAVVGSGLPGGAVAGSGVVGSGLPGGAVAGSGLPGGAVAGSGLPGGAVAGSGVVGSGLPGGAVAGSGLPGGAVAGSGVAGSGLPGAAVAGSGVLRSRLPGGAVAGSGVPGEGLTGAAGDSPPGLDAVSVSPVITPVAQVPPASVLGVQPGGTATGLAGTPGQQADGERVTGLLATTAGAATTAGGVLGVPDSLTAAPGHVPAARASVGDIGIPGGLATAGGFSGTIGRKDQGAAAGDRGSRERPRGREQAHKRRTAPSAGFSLGRHANGSVLEQSAVPVIDGGPRSSAVPSSALNAQVIPGGPAGGALPAHELAGAGSIGSFPGTEGTVPGAAMIRNPGAALGREMTGAGRLGPMLMPGGGMGGSAQSGEERERLAYLPEEEEYWGTEPGLPDAPVSPGDQNESDGPEHGAGPAVAIGIGADGGPGPSEFADQKG
jgi:hypothetical protein